MTFSKLQSSTGTFMRVRISLRLGGAPIAIAMLSPDGRRGAADQGWVLEQGNQTIFTPCFHHTVFSMVRLGDVPAKCSLAGLILAGGLICVTSGLFMAGHLNARSTLLRGNSTHPPDLA